MHIHNNIQCILQYCQDFCQSFLTVVKTLDPSAVLADHNISHSVCKLWPSLCTEVQPCLWKPAVTWAGRDASADFYKTRSVKNRADTLNSYSIYSHEQKRGGSPELDTDTHTLPYGDAVNVIKEMLRVFLIN